MANSEEIRTRITAFVRELALDLGEVDESLGDCWLDAVENQAVALGDAISVELARQLSQRRAAAEEAPCPQCGAPGRYEGVRTRELISRRGPVTITEPEYFCPCCRKTFCPVDQHDRR